MTQLTQTPTKRYARDNLQTTSFGIASFLSLSLSFFLSSRLPLTIGLYIHSLTSRYFVCILFIAAPPEPVLRRLWNSATAVSSPSRTTYQRQDTRRLIRTGTNRVSFRKRHQKPRKKRVSPHPRRKRRPSRFKNTTPGRRAIAQNSSPKTSSVVVSGSPPRAHRVKKPTEAPVKSV